MPKPTFGLDDLFVAPQGNDQWSGRRPRPNAAKTDGPLATLSAARDAIRRRKGLLPSQRHEPLTAELNRPLTVWLRGGRYELAEPVVFGPEDSAPVTYAAYPGETPVLDGGRRITEWRVTTVNGVKAWVADLPEVAAGKWHFRELFLDGQRRPRPRLPRRGLHRMESAPDHPVQGGWGPGGYTKFVAAAGDVRPFRNLTDVEVVYVHFWIEERAAIAAYDSATRLVTMSRPSWAPLFGSYGSQLADYYLDNVFEALTEPGEWYLDRVAGKLYYLPRPGETPRTTAVYAPRLLQLLALKGEADAQKHVEFLRFAGLTFRHTDWRHPDVSDGASSAGRGHGRGNRAGFAQGAADVPGVIVFEAARHCAVEDCTIEHVGWYGIEIGDACWGLQVVGNTLRDLGAGGVRLNGAAAGEPVHRRTGHHRITDNTIHAGGRVFHSGIGVLAMHSFGNTISHNHIYDLYYSGISCGWVWGYTESVSRDNRIEKNHIHDLGQGLLSDMGGIYLLGVQPGTVVRGNLIHDIVKAHYGAWCIYPDEGSSHLLIENNVCYRTNDNIFHQHYGRENLVRNNVFAFAANAILAHSRLDLGHRGISFERNILLTDGAPIFQAGYGGRLADRNHGSDLNLLWDVGRRPLRFHEKATNATFSLKAWRALGHDRHSVVADPKCRNPRRGDFRLAPDSPAFKVGFQPIALHDVGPRPKTRR